MRFILSIAIAVLPLLTFGQVPFSLQDRPFITSTSPLRNNLAGYWRLEESSGTRYDESPNGNHLTSNNSVGQAAGVSAYTGNCATLASASSQYLSIADNTSLSLGDSSFTIAAWVYLASTNVAQAICSKRDSVGSAGTWNFLWQSSANRFQLLVYGAAGALRGNATANTFGAPALNTWYFVVGRHDADANTVAISVNNGTFDSVATSGALIDDTSPVQFGAQNITPASLLNGRLDEVGIWRRILTSAEITQLYNAGLGTHFPWAHP